jgi:twitching motility protein PilT
MSQRISLNTYRLRREAMAMGVFTANNLASAAEVSNQTVQDFLGNLRREGSQFLEIETLPSLKPGRRVHRYTLTPKGLAQLATANTPYNREINEEAFRKDPALHLKPATVEPPRSSWTEQIERWLGKSLPEFQTFIDQGASTLLIRAGEAGAVRFGERMCPSCTEHIWTPNEVDSVFQNIFNPAQHERLAKQGWIAYAYASENCKPIEICAKLAAGRPVLEFRFLPRHVPTFDELHLPPLVESLSSEKSGLILVTGLAGSGKSGTIAAMIGNINAKKPGYITTIDEPIRYFHSSRESFIEQRQIGIDTPDFSPAIDQALANRSTVVAVSDVPDRESFATILAAASRALVFCRVAAPSPAEAIRKLVNLMPEAEQIAARTRLAQSLAGIICVAGLPDVSGTGMVAATEILGWRPEAREAILNPERTGFLVEELTRVHGRVETMAASVHNLRVKGLISEETAERCEGLKQEYPARG